MICLPNKHGDFPCFLVMFDISHAPLDAILAPPESPKWDAFVGPTSQVVSSPSSLWKLQVSILLLILLHYFTPLFMLDLRKNPVAEHNRILQARKKQTYHRVI